MIAMWKVPHGSCDQGRLQIMAHQRRIESHETDQRGHLCAPDSIWGALSFFSCHLRRRCKIKIRAAHSRSRSHGFHILISGEICLFACVLFFGHSFARFPLLRRQTPRGMAHLALCLQSSPKKMVEPFVTSEKELCHISSVCLVYNYEKLLL